MKITINGKAEEIPESLSLREFLEMKHVTTDHVVVEHNQNIVKRGNWHQTMLHEGDRLEIVSFVGGG